MRAKLTTLLTTTITTIMEDGLDDTTQRFYEVFKNVLCMLSDRGYVITDAEKEISPQEFNSRFNEAKRSYV